MKPYDGCNLDGTRLPDRRQAGVAHRLGWTVADQGLSSVTNLGAAILAAHSLDRQAFGAFGLAWTVYLLALGACRALTTEPLVSRHSLATPESLRPIGGAATGAALAFGLIGSGGLATIAVALNGTVRDGLLALGLVLPCLLLQDAWRYYFVTAGRPRDAALNDAIWLAALAGFLGILVPTGHVTLTSIILCFGASAGVAALAGCVQANVVPRLGSALGWLSRHRGLNARYLAEFTMASGASQVTLVGLGALAGLGALGAIRGSYVFFGPINVLSGAAFLALSAEGARLRLNPVGLRRMMFFTTGALVLLSAGWIILGLNIPQNIGQKIFGDTWAPARSVLIPVGFIYIGGSAAIGAIAGLRALAAAKQSLHARLLGLPVVIIAPLLGASWGARGFATGLAFGCCLGAVIWWRQFERALANDLLPRSQSMPTGDADEPLSVVGTRHEGALLKAEGDPSSSVAPR